MEKRQCINPFRILLLVAGVAGLLIAGCVSTTNQLSTVQDEFIAANQNFVSATDAHRLTADQEAAYRRVVRQIEDEQLKAVDRDDLKVVAYAIDAFSKWRLKDYANAKATAEKGLDVYVRAGLTTNRREYGMLLITGGLADYSQTFREYQAWLDQHPGDFMPVGEATDYTQGIAAAIGKIDGVNRPEKGLARDEPVVIYANQQQLRAMTTILDVWGQVRDVADQKAPVCRWTGRAAALVRDGFPAAGDYAGKAHTDDLAGKIAAVGESYHCNQ